MPETPPSGSCPASVLDSSVPYGDVNDAGRRKIADRIDIGELRKHAGRTGAIPHMHELAVPGND